MPIINSLGIQLSGSTGTGMFVGDTGANLTNTTLNSPALTSAILGTPSSGTLTNCTGLPIGSGVSNLATGISTFLSAPTSAHLLAAVTNPSGTGNLVFNNGPAFVSPILGTPASGILSNCTGLLATGLASTAGGGTVVTTEIDGTFTPALAFGGSSTGITYSAQNGYYTRIGNVVTFTLIIALTNMGSATGIATITGIPFAARVASSQLFDALFDNITYPSTPILVSVASGASILHFTYSVSGGSSANLDNTAFTNTTDFVVSGTYLV